MAPPPGATVVESSPSRGSPTRGRPTSSASFDKEYSYHHVDHDGNPLHHGRHRVLHSGEVSFAGSATRPEQVHLTFADRADEMRVMFVCADAGKRAVRYGLEKEEEKGWTEVGTEVRTYEQKHMCDAPANDSVGWRDPGFVFDGLMNGLEPGRRYFYKVNQRLNSPQENTQRLNLQKTNFINRDSNFAPSIWLRSSDAFRD